MNDTLFTCYADTSDKTRIDEAFRKSQVSVERIAAMRWSTRENLTVSRNHLTINSVCHCPAEQRVSCFSN